MCATLAQVRILRHVYNFDAIYPDIRYNFFFPEVFGSLYSIELFYRIGCRESKLGFILRASPAWRGEKARRGDLSKMPEMHCAKSCGWRLFSDAASRVFIPALSRDTFRIEQSFLRARIHVIPGDVVLHPNQIGNNLEKVIETLINETLSLFLRKFEWIIYAELIMRSCNFILYILYIYII